MTNSAIPNNKNISDAIKNVTIYPSGKENIGQEPIKGETFLQRDKNSKLEKGLRIAGGVVAFVAACSLFSEDPVTFEKTQTAINSMVGTAGEVIMFAGGSLVASGKKGRKFVTEVAREVSSDLKKKIDSLKEKTKPSTQDTEFTVYGPKSDGSEGVEVKFVEFAKKNGRGK